MSYRILAQKYRPQTFEDLIGQEVVTRTLKNAVLQERIANAYIFCGPRGVGKTSVARLLSKTLNCEETLEKRPCNKCDSCIEITNGNSIDVLEIDGASNNRVDEIRVLLENVQFSPSKGKYKIYIIDEVHMLSPGAFNALLKTLEEPPAHVKFIFATTEHHKVLPTIMSRCQRFDFKRIPPKLIFDRMIDIAKREKIDIDEQAALLISRSADGSLRDGLVILDQMVSFSQGKILADDVVELLGMVHKDKIFSLSGAIIDNDAKVAVRLLDELINNGKDPVFITNSLMSHYRDLMILKTAMEPTADMAFSEDEMKSLNAQVEKLSIEEILYILQNLSYCLTLMKGAMFARAPLEVAVIRLTKRGSIFSLKDVVSKMEKGETFAIPAQESVPTARPAAAIPKVQSALSVPDAGVVKENITAVPNTIEQGRVIDDTEETESIDPDAYWKAMLNYIKNKRMSVFTFLNVAKPVDLGEKVFLIGFGKDHAFNKEALETGQNKLIIEEAANKVMGKPMRVEFTLLGFLGETAEKKEEVQVKEAKSKEQMKPVIEKAMDVFGGHVVRDFKEG